MAPRAGHKAAEVRPERIPEDPFRMVLERLSFTFGLVCSIDPWSSPNWTPKECARAGVALGDQQQLARRSLLKTRPKVGFLWGQFRQL